MDERPTARRAACFHNHGDCQRYYDVLYMDYMDYMDYIYIYMDYMYIYMDYMDYLWIMMMIFLNVVDCYDVLLVYPIIFPFIFSTTLHGEAEVPMKQKQHIYLVGGFNPSEKY